MHPKCIFWICTLLLFIFCALSYFVLQLLSGNFSLDSILDYDLIVDYHFCVCFTDLLLCKGDFYICSSVHLVQTKDNKLYNVAGFFFAFWFLFTPHRLLWSKSKLVKRTKMPDYGSWFRAQQLGLFQFRSHSHHKNNRSRV